MATFSGNRGGSTIRAGVVTAAEVTVAPSAQSSRLTLWDTDSAATWACALFIFALVMLYIIL